eukprot:scaffold834_cov123-Cylindrotheca_fusiformis.AAC.23
MTGARSEEHDKRVWVDVIIPVHNAEATIEDAVTSAMQQDIPQHLVHTAYDIRITVCCYDDGSTDDSFAILQRMKKTSLDGCETPGTTRLPSTLLIEASIDGKARGAGYARNKAVQMHRSVLEHVCSKAEHFLCLLDSDDTMHRHRIAEQTNFMLNIVEPGVMGRTLLGCQFVRDPPDSTWHYSRWANSLSDERLMMEKYREVTVLQPTWFLCRSRWASLGGYVEAPLSGTVAELVGKEKACGRRRLIHENHDSLETLRLAEDLRFFHEHLWANGTIQLHRTEVPLVTYRHNGQSQSYRTSRQLLQQLRTLAFQHSVLESDPRWLEDDGSFVVWGAGRDGKDFVKSLDPEMRKRVYCFADLDSRKLEIGSYMNREMNLNIPIIHFSYLAKDIEVGNTLRKEWEENITNEVISGRIDKSRSSDKKTYSREIRSVKRQRTAKAPKLHISGLSQQKLQKLPVVVCVAMYRTNGALEKNVKAIDRTEGEDLWHFS